MRLPGAKPRYIAYGKYAEHPITECPQSVAQLYHALNLDYKSRMPNQKENLGENGWTEKDLKQGRVLGGSPPSQDNHAAWGWRDDKGTFCQPNISLQKKSTQSSPSDLTKTTWPRTELQGSCHEADFEI